MRHRDQLLVAAFLATILAPGLGLIVGVDGAGDDENRESAPAPPRPASWRELRTWPDAFTSYFEDHFALRDLFVQTQAAFRLRMLGVSPSPAVIAGRDGWYYYADDSALEDFAVPWALTAQDLATWRNALQDTQDWLASRGIAYAFVIAPDKHVIYPEFMPGGIRQLRLASWTDQLISHLRSHSSVNVVDLRPLLLHAKSVERVYSKTDTHWNDRGAHLAYSAIVESLGGAYGLRPAPRSAFVEGTRTVPGMDLAGMLGLKESIVEVDLALVPKSPRRARRTEPPESAAHGMYPRMVTEIPGATLPRAVIFRDSFASGLAPFLSEHFSRAVYLWEYDVNPDIIAVERPQVVIQQIVGRHLGHVLPYNYVAALKDSEVEDPAQSGDAAATRSAHLTHPD